MEAVLLIFLILVVGPASSVVLDFVFRSLLGLNEKRADHPKIDRPFH